MEEVKQPSKTTSLVQKSCTCDYKLVIPAEVERKIRFVCQKVWNTEWSGALFFSHEGSFENNDLVIRCTDIFIMDIGTQTYTEFDMNPDIIAYMSENPELLDCQIGLIHSHHNMPAFFSGTDTSTLKEEGKCRNNFVSLIVNNAGIYTAAITRRIKSKKIKETLSYEFFGDGEKHNTRDYTVSADEIEYFYLKIEKEGDNYSFPDITARLEGVKQAKCNSVNLINSDSATIAEKNGTEPIATQMTLFDDIAYDCVSFDKEIINSLVLQLVTGSILVTGDNKIDIIEWSKSMPALYEKRFGKGKEGFDNFKSWADTYTEYLTWGATDKKLEELNFDETEICAICARDMIKKLSIFPENIYIKGYIDALQQYLNI